MRVNLTDQHLDLDEYDDNRLNKWYFLTYVMVSIPFLMLFYDTFNLNANIFSTENLILGLNPYSHQSLLVIGYTALPYNYFLTWLYNIDGFNAYLVVIIIKLIAMFFTIGSALLIYKILLTLNVNSKKAKTAMLTYLFSPFVIFVDYIWVQPEFYSIFFLLLGIYVFERYNILGGKFIDLIVISFSLLIASITFYFPLFLIPGYLIYLRGKLPKIKLLGALVISGVALVLPIILFNLRTTFSLTLAGKNVNIFPYSLISLFLTAKDPLGEIELFIEGSFIVLAFIMPLLLYWYKKSIYLSQIIVLAILFSFQITGINPDTFIFLIPFIIIEYALLDRENLSVWKIIVLQMVLLPEYINLQFLNGPGYVTGIYYWIYFWYHKNIVFLAKIRYRQLITQILNASTFILIYSTILYFIKTGKRKEKGLDEKKGYESLKTRESKQPKEKPHKASISLITVAVIFLVLILSIPLSLSHNTSFFETKDKFPIMMYMSNDPQNCQYIMQNKNTYYYSQNNTLSFYNGNTVTYLYKNTTNENYRMIGNISFMDSPNIIKPQEIFHLGTSFAGITNFLNVNKSTEILPISHQNNLSILKFTNSESLGCYLNAHSGTDIIQLNSSSSFGSIFNYHLLLNRTTYFVIGIKNITRFNSTVLEIKLGSTCNELYLNNSFFYAGPILKSINQGQLTRYYTPFTQTITINGKNVSASWSIVGVSFDNSSSGFLVLNGMRIPMSFENHSSMNSTILTIGTPQSNNSYNYLDKNSFFTTEPYVIDQNDSAIGRGVFFHYNNLTKLSPIENSNSHLQKIPFTINITDNTSTLLIGSIEEKILGHFPEIAFGQIDTPSFSIYMNISYIRIQKELQTLNYSLIILTDAVVLPLGVFLFWALDLYFNKRL